MTLKPRRAKQVLVVRKDLGMRKGKIAAQCAHASMKVLLDAMPSAPDSEHPEDRLRVLRYTSSSALGHWLDGAFAKICVYVQSEEALEEIYQRALEAKLPAALIIDSGRTEFAGVPTKTVVAVGPAWIDEVDEVTGGLPLL